MPFIAKTAPVSARAGEIVLIDERPMYGGKDIDTGDTVFLWASEQQGGRGLWARGVVLRVQARGRKLGAEVRIDQLLAKGQFGLNEIAPHRDSTAGTAIAGLARKLYRHAHNKVAALTNAEADLLLQHFQ